LNLTIKEGMVKLKKGEKKKEKRRGGGRGITS
jgi:hypothetical protein